MKSSHILLICVGSLLLPLTLAAESETPSASGQILQACPLPDKPNIPNGRTSSREEMVEAHGKMKAYMTEGNEVIDCLNELETSWGETASEEQRAVVILFHNKMVDEMEAIAELFNSALRAYKGRQ
ncbi:MAG: hypothetical protein ACR2P9_03825 [Gammaproteobacteria bacterium]